MGLGKTLQSICILASKHFERSQRGEAHLPSLIICPPTLTGHWYHEILKYAPSLKPLLYTGPTRDRRKHIPSIKRHDVVITSYDVIRNDINELSVTNWLYCILDEGHIIKNAKTKLTQAVKQVQSQHRLILSGTPIQNNVLELWSLFDFLMPGFLGSEASFNERFGKPILANREGKGNAKSAEAGEYVNLVLFSGLNTPQRLSPSRLYISKFCPSYFDASKKMSSMTFRQRSYKTTIASYQTFRNSCTTNSQSHRHRLPP
jgi:TATA-binding protein-associated factor